MNKPIFKNPHRRMARQQGLVPGFWERATREPQTFAHELLCGGSWNRRDRRKPPATLLYMRRYFVSINIFVIFHGEAGKNE